MSFVQSVIQKNLIYWRLNSQMLECQYGKWRKKVIEFYSWWFTQTQTHCILFSMRNSVCLFLKEIVSGGANTGDYNLCSSGSYIETTTTSRPSSWTMCLSHTLSCVSKRKFLSFKIVVSWFHIRNFAHANSSYWASEGLSRWRLRDAILPCGLWSGAICHNPCNTREQRPLGVWSNWSSHHCRPPRPAIWAFWVSAYLLHVRPLRRRHDVK